MKLHYRAIDALKPGTDRAVYWFDGRPGFGMRVTARGVKTWVFQYRRKADGKVRMMTLGRYPLLQVTDAATEYERAKRVVDEGGDPAAPPATGVTVGAMLDAYYEARAGQKSLPEVRRLLDRDVRPRLGAAPADAVTRADVRQMLDEIVERGAPVVANRTLAWLRRVYNWANGRDMVEGTPCLGLEAPAEEARRERLLTDAELRLAWQGVRSAPGLSDPVRRAIMFLMWVPARKGEALPMAAGAVDADGWWTLWADETKQAVAHRYFVPTAARPLVDVRQGRVFASPKAASGYVTDHALNHALRRHCPAWGVAPFGPHDLRRTIATGLGRLGVDPFVVARVLGHADSSVTAIYNLYRYDPQKREAMERWEAHLRQVLSLPEASTEGSP